MSAIKEAAFLLFFGDSKFLLGRQKKFSGVAPNGIVTAPVVACFCSLG